MVCPERKLKEAVARSGPLAHGELRELLAKSAKVEMASARVLETARLPTRRAWQATEPSETI